MNIADYLESQDTLAEECFDDFLLKAKLARWQVPNLCPEVFSQIYRNLVVVMSGGPETKIVDMDKHWPFLDSLHLRSKLSYLMELHFTAESCLRDRLLSLKPSEDCLTERAMLYEEVNGAFHNLLDQGMPPCCDGCIAPLRERFLKLREQGAESYVTDLLISDSQLIQRVPETPCPLPNDFPEGGNRLLDIFLTEGNPELYDLWTTRMTTPLPSACSISLQEAVRYCIKTIRACLGKDKAHARSLIQGAPHFGPKYSLALCTVGEEAFASFLALRSPFGEEWRMHARSGINQSFHALLRGLIHSDCQRCATKLTRAAEIVACALPLDSENL